MPNLTLRPPPLRHPLPSPCHAAIKVHAENANRRIVLDAQIDVLADSEAKVARRAEVAAAQFVLLDLETALEDLFGFGTPHRDVHGDFLVAPDAEGAHGVAGFGVHWGLARELFEDFGGAGEAIAGFTDGDVEDEFLICS